MELYHKNLEVSNLLKLNSPSSCHLLGVANLSWMKTSSLALQNKALVTQTWESRLFLNSTYKKNMILLVVQRFNHALEV